MENTGTVCYLVGAEAKVLYDILDDSIMNGICLPWKCKNMVVWPYIVHFSYNWQYSYGKWQGVTCYLQKKSREGVCFSKHSWQPHRSGPMSNMFGMIQERISWPHIYLGTTLRLKSRKNKYANQGSTQLFVPLEHCTTYAFHAGLFHISVFLPFLSHACHVWQA